LKSQVFFGISVKVVSFEEWFTVHGSMKERAIRYAVLGLFMLVGRNWIWLFIDGSFIVNTIPLTTTVANDFLRTD